MSMQVIDLDFLSEVSGNLQEFMQRSGTDIYDNIITQNSVALAGIGGISAPLLFSELGIGVVEKATYKTMGASSAMSYLNPSSIDLDELAEKVFGIGHFSISHTVSVNILVSGVTLGCEAEFNTQRDLVHTSRITIARTTCQNDPPYVALDDKMIPYLKQMREVINQFPKGKTKDEREAMNLLHPSCKATAFLLSGTLRNFQNLVGADEDPGKEKEYREVLKKIRSTLKNLWPKLF